MITFFPKYYTNKAVLVYLLLLVIIPILFGHAIEWYFVIMGILGVVCFFYFSNELTKSTSNYSIHLFEKKLLVWSLSIRILYVIFSYFFYISLNGNSFEFHPADVMYYHSNALLCAESMRDGTFSILDPFPFAPDTQFADTGYPLYLSFIYFISDDSIFLARILKAVWSSITVLLVYRIASRNFPEHVARVASVFCLLMPNFLYYCGSHLKETEMVFLTVLFIERADYILHSKKFSIIQTVFLVFIGFLTFMFRTVLGATLFVAFFAALLFNTNRFLSLGKKIVISCLVFLMIGLVFSDRIYMEVQNVWETKGSGQKANMEWRSRHKHGNEFAKYAGAAVFAPLIFTIPFPTLVETPLQENQRMIHSGNYIKNILSFFTICAVFYLIFGGDWRKHTLLLSFFIGYLIVLVFSSFAQSERFHMPILPFSLMFAAYGLSILKDKQRKYFNYWLVFIFVANVAWAWFKLKGRGMI